MRGALPFVPNRWQQKAKTNNNNRRWFVIHNLYWISSSTAMQHQYSDIFTNTYCGGVGPWLNESTFDVRAFHECLLCSSIFGVFLLFARFYQWLLWMSARVRAHRISIDSLPRSMLYDSNAVLYCWPLTLCSSSPTLIYAAALLLLSFICAASSHRCVC